MAGVLCSMVGASFVTAVAEVIRRKASVIAFGNAQIDTAQSKFGGSSALFDGTGDYLEIVPTSGLADLMNNDFTIELQFRSPLTGIDGTFGDHLIGVVNGGSGSNGWIVRLKSNATLEWIFDGQGGYAVSGFTASANTWHHIAFVRSGTTLKCYTDGVERTVTSYVDRKSNSGTFNIRIGKVYNSLNDDYNGWIDEVRISNSVRYTTGFTAPTAPFTNDTNTLFLMHCDGTDATTYFEDDNGVRSPKGLFAVNQAQIDTAQSRFGGASALFDGTGDYIQSSVANDLQFTGNFTVELWVRLASTGAIRVPIGNRSGGTGAGIWWVEIGSDQTGYTAWQNTAGTNYYPTYSGTISTNTWTHLAVVRNGSTLTLYKDGVAGTAATGVTGTFGLTNGGIFIGGIAGSFNWNGHIDEVRISNTARYTANFTAPSAPFVNDSNTVLLVHMDGTDASTVFRDDNGVRAQTGIIAFGNAQVDTAQSKFGGASLLCDGTGDYLRSPLDAIGTGDFTVEFWIRRNRTGTQEIIWDARTNAPAIYIRGDNNYIVYIKSADHITSTTALSSTSTWYHIAVVRSSGITKLYVNGTKEGSDYTDNNNYTASTSFIGIGFDAATSAFQGWIDEFRISNNARYTANFTPSTTPFSNDANTLLLLHMDGTDGSTVFFDDNGQVPQTP